MSITLDPISFGSPPPPDSSSSSSSPSPPPPSTPPADSSPPPPEQTSSPPPPPPPAQADPPPESTPSPPSPPTDIPSPPSPPTKSSPDSPPKSDQPKSSDAQNSPPSGNDSPALALAPPESNASPTTRLAPPSAASSAGSASSNVVLIVGICVAGSLILALIIGCFLNKRKKKRSYYYENERSHHGDWNRQHSSEHVVKVPTQPLNGGQWGAPPINSSGEYNYSGQYGQGVPPPQSPMGGLGYNSQFQFSYEDLAAATSGFSPANLLGQGGFGYVHKGVLPDGRVVAVKSLKSGSGQGEREFQAEVDIISRVHHRHLVSLVGYCIADGQRMLVYEFVANSTMEHHLHGKGQPVMDWSSRIRIAIGAAKGLAYLHEDCHPRIIHRDIKAANILLDENFEAMVADFGLAKLTTDNFTHVSTRVMGTFGYLAPEYAASGKLSEKSDVFSFGVMLLELITGRLPVDLTGQVMEDSLVDWARPLLAEALEHGDYSELADPNMEGDYDCHQMASMISCAAGSIRHSAKRRPRMSQIVRALEGESLLAEEGNEIPKRPRSNTGSGSAATSHDSTYDTVAYNNDLMKFKKMVLHDDD